MHLHEYQAKEILKSFNVKISKEIITFDAEETVEASTGSAKKTGLAYFVVKARIYSGERGKGGVIKIA